MDANYSEVVRLRTQIEQESLAAQRALYSYAYAARHDFIEARINSMGDCQRQLARLVGEQEAFAVVLDALERAGESVTELL